MGGKDIFGASYVYQDHPPLQMDNKHQHPQIKLIVAKSLFQLEQRIK